MNPPLDRITLLETCFADIPQKVGPFTLRPMSAGSFTLLGRLGNPMMASSTLAKMEMFEAVVQYAWVHAADLDQVTCIETIDDLPAKDLRKFGFEIPMGEALKFVVTYQKCAERMAAAMAETDEDEEEETTVGKPGSEVQSPAGLPLLSSPLEEQGIPFESDTSSGISPSSEHSAICTPAILLTEPFADGLATSMSEAEPSNPSLPDSQP